MNTCRPCGIRNIVTEATWVMETTEAKEWYLCDKHAQAVAASLVGTFRPLRQLGNAEEIRRRQREESTHEHNATRAH